MRNLKPKYRFVLVLLLGVLLYSCAGNSQISLQLTEKRRYGGQPYLNLEISNPSDSPLEILPITDGSLWCWAQPCIRFIIRKKVNGEWVYSDGNPASRCRVYDEDWETNTPLIIAPNTTLELTVGGLSLPNPNWFGLTNFEEKGVEISVSYSLRELSIQSNFIPVNYRSEILQNSIYDFYNTARKRNDFDKNAVEIAKPSSPEDALRLGLKGMPNSKIKFNDVEVLKSYENRIGLAYFYSVLFRYDGKLLIALYTPQYEFQNVFLELKAPNASQDFYFFNIYHL
ncbi:hypothetical protein N8836_03140 [Flavobacteriaceae bacterium]|jgi:hypothetical protein|nr:hypothetical protein [Flavobacteriaceae bacterium]MDA7724581.1 hypothetical protein [Flavobacteriaceae bacterium]MDA7728007.1 hypothetical protein [Flavobacteriaceae bacterium]MDA7849373.1 hypothetical protein [Flavobacteriaceae bacterium]MDB0004002.1 hypothetical protein [Flavobacteriaceae bacterium]